LTTQTQYKHLKETETDIDPVQNGNHQLPQQAKKHTLIMDAIKSLWAIDKLAG